jgi:hypothetical protein
MLSVFFVSFDYLGSSFFKTVLQHTTTWNETTESHVCSVENGGTRFFFDFTENHDCAGIDWLGKFESDSQDTIK